MTRVALTIQRFYRGFKVRKRFAKNGPLYNLLLKEKERYNNRQLSKSLDISADKASQRRTVKKSPISSRTKTVNERARVQHQKELKFSRVKVAREDLGDDDYDDLKFVEQCKQLIIACRKNQLEKIQLLDFVILRSHTRYQDEKQNTVLYYAAKHKSLKVCHMLLEKGADPNDICSEGNTPYHMACLGNNVAVAYT